MKIFKNRLIFCRHILLWNKSGVTANFAMPLHAAAVQ